PRADVERTGQVELLVLAGRENPALLTSEHPVASDLWVEMDVDLILVEDGFVSARARLQRANLSNSLLAGVTRPVAEDDRLRRAEAGSDLCKRATHRADGNCRAPFPLHLPAQELPRPG